MMLEAFIVQNKYRIAVLDGIIIQADTELKDSLFRNIEIFKKLANNFGWKIERM